MEGTENKDQPTDQKVQWASVSDDEEEEEQQRQAAKKTQPKKKKAPATGKPSKASNNVFVCHDLDVEDDEDEPDQPVKKEKGSMRDFVGQSSNTEQKKEEKPALSKKEQKKKELEDFDKALEEFKLSAPATEPVAETNVASGEVIKAPADKATEKENIDANDAEKKKKKKKKAKEGKKEDEQPAEEKKEGETQPAAAGPVDVEKRIQEIMKSKAKTAQPKKTSGPNLDAAKQEILARQQKKTTKKKYEDL